MSADLPPGISTFLLSLWMHTLGYSPTHNRDTICREGRGGSMVYKQGPPQHRELFSTMSALSSGPVTLIPHGTKHSREKEEPVTHTQ